MWSCLCRDPWKERFDCLNFEAIATGLLYWEGLEVTNLAWVQIAIKGGLVQLFETGLQKVLYEKVFFQKAEYLVKTVKKCFLKILSVWLALIKVAVWGINYQKRQCIYNRVYFILKSIL